MDNSLSPSNFSEDSIQKDFRKEALKLRNILLEGDMNNIKKALEDLKMKANKNLEEELLKGVIYENAEETTGYKSWNFVPNSFFTHPDHDSFPTNTGYLWYSLLSLIGSSQSETAITLRKNTNSLNLSGLNLPELPPEIGEFSNLTDLNLNNCLEVSFPSEEAEPKYFPKELGKLKKLTSFDMGQNVNVYPPKELAELKGLQSLNLSSNQLSNFPKEICSLKDLQTLLLDNNSFSSLPDSIGDLTELTELNLWYNKLNTIPPTIGKLKKLEVLELGGNPINSLPDEMKTLTSLKTLSLHDHQLSSFPDVLKRLKNLSNLEAEFTPWKSEGEVSEGHSTGFSEEITAIDERLQVLPLEDGKPKAVTCYKNKILYSTSEKIILLNAENLELIWETEVEQVNHLCFSPNGKFFLCASENGFIQRYDLVSSGAKQGWEIKSEAMLVSIAISKDSESFAVCYQDMKGLIHIGNCSDGSNEMEIGDTEEDETAYEGYGYSSLCFSKDGDKIFAADQDWSRVRIWDLETGEILPPLEEDGVQFLSVDVSADGKYLFTGTVETEGAVWNLENQEHIMSLEDKIGITRRVCAHPKNGSVLATASFDVINVWNIESEEKTTEFCFQKDDYSIDTLSYSEEEFLVALVSYSGFQEQLKETTHIVLAHLN